MQSASTSVKIMAMSSEFTLEAEVTLSTRLLQERIEDAHRAIRTRLATELLQRVKQSPPRFFEQLVIDLLLAMGYGQGSVTKMSGDGGIDGIIHRDPLGLDTLYLQAKRWEHPVGEPQLRDFIGALHVRRARRGVFITTSAFTAPALRYIELADYQISLIDGTKLADLMIDYGIGVSCAHTYEVKKLDSDYFENNRSTW